MSRLHYAAKRGLISEIREAIAAGADVNERTERLPPPLVLAAQMGSLRAVELLLDAGADPVGANSVGWTALHKAASQGHLQIVRRLAQTGMSIDTAGRGGTTPAIAAAMANKRDIAEYLLSLGANPDATDRFGKTVSQWLEIGGLGGQTQATLDRQVPNRLDRAVLFIRQLMTQAPSVEEYAAHHARRTILFSFGYEDLPDPEADRWAKRYAEILASPELMAQCEERFLKGEELEQARIAHARAMKSAERRRLRDERRRALQGEI